MWHDPRPAPVATKMQICSRNSYPLQFFQPLACVAGVEMGRGQGKREGVFSPSPSPSPLPPLFAPATQAISSSLFLSLFPFRIGQFIPDFKQNDNWALRRGGEGQNCPPLAHPWCTPSGLSAQSLPRFPINAWTIFCKMATHDDQVCAYSKARNSWQAP